MEFPCVAGQLFGVGETDDSFVAAAVIALLAIGPVMKRLVPEGSLRDNLYNFTRRWARLS